MGRYGLPDSNITKKALAAALKSLMQTQAFEKISVGEICEVCELSRKSFYYHFKDKYDLVEWIFHTEFITAVTSARVTDRWVFVRALCDYFYRERAFYAKLFHLTGQHSFRQYFSEYLKTPAPMSISVSVFSSLLSAMPCLSPSSAGWMRAPKPRRGNSCTGCNSSPKPLKTPPATA